MAATVTILASKRPSQDYGAIMPPGNGECTQLWVSEHAAIQALQPTQPEKAKLISPRPPLGDERRLWIVSRESAAWMA